MGWMIIRGIRMKAWEVFNYQIPALLNELCSFFLLLQDGHKAFMVKNYRPKTVVVFLKFLDHSLKGQFEGSAIFTGQLEVFPPLIFLAPLLLTLHDSSLQLPMLLSSKLNKFEINKNDYFNCLKLLCKRIMLIL